MDYGWSRNSDNNQDLPLISATFSLRRPFLALCAIWGVLYLQVLTGHKVLPWDAMDEFYPTVFFNAHNLRLGIAPWWNPYIYSGFPQIADPQGMLFSPLLMAWMLLRQSPSPLWFDWGVLLHLLMGGTAMLALLRRYGANAFGSLLGATVFMAGGVAAARLEHTPDMIAYAYAPVVLLAMRTFFTMPSMGRGCLMGLAAGAMVTQLVQISYLLALAALLYALAEMGSQWRPYTAASRRQCLIGTVVAVACALVIAAPQLLFSWAFMSMSNRTAVPLAASAGASLDLRAFISMFAPNGLHTFQGTYDGPASLVESYLYIGVVPMLSLFGMARALKERKLRRPVIFFIVLTVLATLYVMGTNTPFYRWLYTWLPGLTHFRRPADAAYLLNLAFAVIVGLCAAQIDLQSRDEITLLLACTAGWLALIAAQMHEHRFGLFGCAALAALALWRLRKPGSEWRATAWLIAVLVVDYSGLNLNGRFSAMNDTTRVFQRSKAVQYLQKDLNDNAGVMPWRIATQNTSTTWDNGVVLSGLSSTQGYNPLRIANYQHWYAPRESSNAHRIDNPLNASPDYTLDKLLGVKFLVMGHRTDLQAVSPPSTYTRVFGDEDVDIWRNDDTYPHVLNPQHAMFVAADQPMDASTFSSTNFHDTVWLTPRDEEDSRNDRVAAATCTGQAAAHATRWEPTQATMAVHASHAGWLVVDDLDFAGWRAQIDGVPLPIHRANGMFRAVCVPAGDHELQFTFHPLLMVADAWSHRRT